MRKLYVLFTFVFFSAAYGQDPFISTWNVTSQNLSIFIPISGENFSIDFGDGTVLTGLASGTSHTYATEGNYSVSVSGNYNRISFWNAPIDALHIVSIDQWGDAQWITMEQAFKGMSGLEINAVDTPDLTQVESMKETFMYTFEFSPTINNWDVSHVTNMEGCFKNATFNYPLNNWDVSNVTTMKEMFYESDFNQNINNWDVSSVENMGYMFQGAANFNMPINNWNVSNVTDMQYMFYLASMFNQPLDNWNVSSVINMSFMFHEAESFNQPLDNWDVGSVTNMESMFDRASGFNKPLNNWDVSNVVNMRSMFHSAFNFNQPLNNWDVSNVLNMTGMFNYADLFNQDLSDWNFNSDVIFGEFLSIGLDINNFDSLLLRFAQLGLHDKYLGAPSIYYCDITLYDYLTNNLGWQISSGGLGENCQGNIISGIVHYDENGNGCDASDLTVNNFLIGVNVDNGPYIYTSAVNTVGEYEVKVMENTYETAILNLPDYFTADIQTVTFEGFGNEQEINFCLTSNQSAQDLNITLLPIGGAPRPGFSSQYQLIAQNIGTQTVSNATVSLAYDNTIQSFTSAVPAATSATAGQLIFDLANLKPFESRIIVISMQTFTPPTVNGGEVINFTASVAPDSGDITPADNTFSLAQTVVNSYDPNDKHVLQGDEISLEQAEGYLDYMIRFQNTGTASAIKVRIEDNLPENVDWTTLRPVSSSHPYTLKLKNDHTVEFIFDNINLPNESADEPGSHGFIAYKIKTVGTVAVGDVITGNAKIFFDYNLPIVTNFATTEVMESMAVDENSASRISIYPNPVSNLLNLNAANGITIEEVKVLNLQGVEVLSPKTTESINVEHLSAGIYILMVKTDAGIEKHKLVKK